MKIEVYPVAEQFDAEYMNSCVKLAKTNMPNWFKESSSYMGDRNDKRLLYKRMTIKKCIPVFDYLSYGINLYMPFSIFVEGTYPERQIHAPGFGAESNYSLKHFCGLGEHPEEQIQKFFVPSKFERRAFKMNFPYIIKTPKGYSSIYVQPQNELYENMYFPRALVNTDSYWNQVNFPFFLSKDFEGTIDAGSHFMSIFFVKRENTELLLKDYGSGKKHFLPSREMTTNWGRHFYKKTR